MMAANTPTEAVKQLFGDHPEGVISSIQRAAETLGWLEEILKTIRDEVPTESSRFRIQKLAALGVDVACDAGNYADHVYGVYISRLQSAGVVQVKP